MPELLTTGQLLDALEIGETARNISFEGYVLRTEKGFMECDDKGNVIKTLKIDNEIINSNWIIEPVFIPFSEAMKVVEQGGKVACLFEGIEITIDSRENKIWSVSKNDACTAGGGATILLAWINSGKWFVKEKGHILPLY